MINIENLTELTPPLKLLESIANLYTSREIDLTLCYNDTIQAYNRKYRQKNQPTDVLSFPIACEIESEIVGAENNFMPLGSIVISVDFVTEKANEFNHSREDELTLLFIHGLLHILGYDHEVDYGEMREKERELIEKFNLPKSLIVRTEEKD